MKKEKEKKKGRKGRIGANKKTEIGNNAFGAVEVGTEVSNENNLEILQRFYKNSVSQCF